MSLGFLAKIFSSLIKPNTETTEVSLYQKPIEKPQSSLLDSITQQIKKDEGLVLHAYTDTVGMLTIGYGRLIDKRRGGGISEAEAEFLLKNDIDRKLRDLRTRLPLFDKLDDARKGVLMNMAFQMGVDGLLKFNKTLTLIEAGDYKAAADNMLKSLWAKQTPARAQRMAEQLRTGQWQSG